MHIMTKVRHHIAAALPGFHAFTGCDNIGRFKGHGKLTCWKTLQKASSNIIEAFVQLGTTSIITPETRTLLEEFVCQLYLPGTTLKELSAVRWHMFKKSCAESEKLPPTSGSLGQHIKRSHYQAMIWNNDKVAKPEIPTPTDYGWTISSEPEAKNLYIPTITDLPPAPMAVLELVRCKCVKAKCRTARCSCRRAGVVCTEMCVCESSYDLCENMYRDTNREADDEDEDDDDDQ